jgi:hypothetical protein
MDLAEHRLPQDGAIQDHARARVIGTRTAGTGTVLSAFGLQDGSALLLGTRKWLTPNGHSIWHQGITPDLVVRLAAAAQLALNRWTHMLGYRGHFLTKSRRYSVTFGQLRTARTEHRRQQRHPGGEHDPWGRPLDDTIVLTLSTWTYAGTGYTTTPDAKLALASAARARAHRQAVPAA